MEIEAKHYIQTW